MQSEYPGTGEFIEISAKQAIAIHYSGRMHNKPDWKVVEEAIDDWLRKNAPGAVGEPEFSGYQWKGLFLPHGTVLRTAYNGKNVHCHVESDRIMYEGKAVSPSGFVGAAGGIRRNAWKSIWLLLPDAKHWQLADHLRVRRRPPKARTRAHDVRSRQAQGEIPPPSKPVAPAPPTMQRADPAPRAAPPTAQATPPDPDPSTVPPRAAHAPPAIAGWARKSRPRGQAGGNTSRLVALLRRELRHDEGRRPGL